MRSFFRTFALARLSNLCPDYLWPEGKPRCRERVFSVDWGIAFGVTGMAIGLLSLVYARTQAVHAQRQADAAQLATALELQRAMAERIYQARMDLVTNPEVAKEYLESNPHLRELYGERATLARSIYDNAVARGALDAQFAAFLLPVFDGKPLNDPKGS
jgi:hypothetical protein